jgi:hypothetical protein
MNCRGLRLELVAGLGIALAMPALAMAANTQGLATQTTLSAETRDQGGRTQATLLVSVTGEDGLPATGAVAIKDHGRQVAGVPLNAEGQATAVVSLAEGDHALRAVYVGDDSHRTSVSRAATVHALASTPPNFGITVAPATITLTAGATGNVVASVTPENASNLTAPMFVELSCSGLPDQATCNFTPQNVEIQPGTTAALTSTMVILTQKASASLAKPADRHNMHPVTLAILLPGVLGLMGLAWGKRRSRWISQVSLMALLGLVTVLGTTACNPRYNYFNHGPIPNPATPAGTYKVTVTAQSDNGITAITNSTTMALTVQ